MSMLKKLKSLFIEEDENDKKGQTSSKKEDQPEKEVVKPEEPTLSMEDIEVPENITGKPDPKFIDILLKAIEKNNMEGFDYLEYKQSLQSLQKMDMDEETRYKSAFAMAKTMGATPKSLLSSAQNYVSILKKEEGKFKDALNNQRNKQIKGRETKIKQLESVVAEKLKTIEKLNKEIEANKKKLEEIKGQINKSAAKVESTNESFNLAYNIVLKQILDDVNRMKSYLE